MLESIGETTIKAAIRVDNNTLAENKQLNMQKTEKLKRERPVEKSEESRKSETASSETDFNENTSTTKFNLEEKRIVFEKYDKNGQLIHRIPPAITTGV